MVFKGSRQDSSSFPVEGQEGDKWWTLFDCMAQGQSSEQIGRFGYFGPTEIWLGSQGSMAVAK
jgi:hypothetical protein